MMQNDTGEPAPSEGVLRRVSIAAIMRESGLSRATVDRVLNGRGNVHPRSRAVVENALRRLQWQEAAAPDPVPVDLLLRVGRGMGQQLRIAWEAHQPDGRLIDMYQAGEADILPVLRELCRDTARALVLCVKNTDRIAAELMQARARGKRIVTLIADMAPGARDFHVGIDDRAAGRTAAFLIGRALGDRPTQAAVVLGDLAFRNHEDREMGFRSGLRSHFPKVVLTGEARGEDNPDTTREAVLRLLQDHPALGAIYNVGGGNSGLVAALRAAGRAGDILVVVHEANAVTLPLLRDGGIDFALAQDPAQLLGEGLRLAQQGTTPPNGDTVYIDLTIHTRFNIPQHVQEAAG